MTTKDSPTENLPDILIVEDDDECFEETCKIFHGFGCNPERIQRAKNLTEAVRAVVGKLCEGADEPLFKKIVLDGNLVKYRKEEDESIMAMAKSLRHAARESGVMEMSDGEVFLRFLNEEFGPELTQSILFKLNTDANYILREMREYIVSLGDSPRVIPGTKNARSFLKTFLENSSNSDQ